MNKRRRFKAKRLRRRCERCGRRIRDHRPFDLPAFIKRQAKLLAADIDARLVADIYGQMWGGHELPNASGHTLTIRAMTRS